SRLNWKKRDPLWVLAMRVHRLAESIEVPWREEYGGCTSWVDLTDGLPDPSELASETALSDTAFKARMEGAVGALGMPLGERARQHDRVRRRATAPERAVQHLYAPGLQPELHDRGAGALRTADHALRPLPAPGLPRLERPTEPATDPASRLLPDVADRLP